MQLIVLVIIGAATGYFAARAMRIEAGLLPAIAIGIVGALVGGIVLRTVIAVTAWLAGLVGAVLGALLLLWLWRQYGPRR